MMTALWRILPERVRRAVPLRVRLAIRELVRQTPDAPVDELLSIVVPVYNTEQYLEAAIESLQAQRYRRFEIIIVDDGSSDGSGRIADRLATADARITVIHQNNRGAGAARNAGISRASGTFLAFLDSDDLVERDGYANAISSLQRTGADFAVAPYRRLRGGKLHLPGRWVQEAHRVERLATTLDAFPGIQANVVACSKVYRRTFFDRTVKAFPEGVVWEDQLPATRSYLHGRFDVLTAPIIRWRVRTDGSSTTQQTASVAHVGDIAEQLGAALDMLRASGHHDAWRERILQILESNPFALGVLHSCDRELWDVIRGAIADILPDAPPALLIERTPARYRVLFHLLAADAREDAMRFFEAGGYSAESWVFSEGPDGLIRGRVPGWTPSIDVPGWAFTASSTELTPRAWIARVDWRDGAVLDISGHVYIHGFEDAAEHTVLLLRDREAVREIRVPVERITSPHATRWSRHRYVAHETAGWRASIDVDELARLAELDGVGHASFEIGLVIEAGGRRLSTSLHSIGFADDADARRAVPVGERGEAWVRVRADPHDLCLEIRQADDVAAVDRIVIDGDAVEIACRSDGPVEAVELVLPRGEVVREAVAGSDSNGFGFILPAGLAEGFSAELRAVRAAGTTLQLRLEADAAVVVGADATAIASYGGRSRIRLRDARGFGVIRSIDVGEEVLEVAVQRVPGRDDAELRMIGNRNTSTARAFRIDDDAVVYRLPLAVAGDDDWRPATLPGGAYRLELGVAEHGIRLVADRDVENRLPVRLAGRGRLRANLVRRPGGEIRIELAARPDVVRRSAFALTQRLEAHRRHRDGLVPHLVLVHVSKEAASEQLLLEMTRFVKAASPDALLVWAIADHATRVPRGAAGVLVDSPAHITAAARAGLVCFGSGMPRWFAPRSGQAVITDVLSEDDPIAAVAQALVATERTVLF
ncbi:glycosyltransferase family 2 protein [Agromyces archimandritae]|uniref:Glycosyltransferase family 2 protein n=1 Tax=Agromyces archimandritae TaxID=2781962 RepID=A0A975IPG6_9MICO|nr:glycosyltransferase family 2 protein [Agromyces archimandritae]QTX05254.1 glycosyltransferase family 2 protein [Agromyces archimandritae]